MRSRVCTRRESSSRRDRRARRRRCALSGRTSGRAFRPALGLRIGGNVGLLDGRRAIITGASKGIGRVMSEMFAREGAQVVCAARTDALVRETVASIASGGGRAIAVVGDAGTEAGAQAIV